jgi:small-conductance mechanosensitive channel
MPSGGRAAGPTGTGSKSTAFLASLRVAGLAVALVAKTILSNVLAGVTLTADCNFRVGDRIEVGDFVGDVLGVNLHKTVIRTRENEIVMIPDGVLCTKIIVNRMLPEQKTRIELQIGVACGTDPERAILLLQEILRTSGRILPEPVPEVNVAALDDNAVVLQVLLWTAPPEGSVPSGTTYSGVPSLSLRRRASKSRFRSAWCTRRTEPPRRREGGVLSPDSPAQFSTGAGAPTFDRK